MGKVKLMFDKSNPDSVSKTEQSHKAACDVNKIVARALKSGVLPVRNSATPMFGDFSNMDFQDIQNKVVAANALFNSLDASIRAKFSNNVVALLNWVADPVNADEARSLGLLPPKTPRELEAEKAAAKAAEAAASGAANTSAAGSAAGTQA